MTSSDGLRSIQGLRVLFFSEGINLNYSKIYQRIIGYLFLAVNLSFTYFNFVQRIFEKLDDFQGARSVILIYRHLMLIIFHHFIFFRTKAILNYLDDLITEGKLSRKQQTRARFYSFTIFPLIAIGIIHKLVFDGTMSKYDRILKLKSMLGLPENIFVNLSGWIYFFIDCFYQEWSVICAFTYILFLYLHHKARMNILSRFSSHRELNNSDLLLTLSQMNNLHTAFETLFSPLPFLSFSQEFLTLTQYTIYYSLNPVETPDQFILVGVKYIRILIHTFFVFSIIYFIVRFNLQLESLVQDISSNVNHNPSFDSLTKMLLIDKVQKMSKQKFTAWNMFDIEKGVILSFLSSLITFNVLFVQIDQKAVVDAD